MRIGCCYAKPEMWSNIAKLGYDYIEGNFSSIARASDEEFEAIKAAQKECGLKIEACNGFFSSKFVLYAYDPMTGKGIAEFEEIEKNVSEYVERGLSRAAQLGTEVVVIGSGGARNIPEDMDRDVAKQQLARVLSICASAAEKYGIAVTVEPLNPSETNTVNTLSDSLDMIDEIGHPNLKAMNDFYHFSMQNEPLSTLDRAGERLVHIHMCRADRYYLTPADKNFAMPIIQYLADMGYDKRISLECIHLPEFLTSAAESYELMKLFRDVKKK